MDKGLIEKKPIGAVVRKTNQAFAQLIRRTTANGNFNRTDWQFFNFVKTKNKVAEVEVFGFLSFLEPEKSIRLVIDRFEKDKLILTQNKEITLTAKGEQVFNEVWVIQEEIKEKSLRDVSEAHYHITLETLQQIVANLKDYLPDPNELK